MNILGGLLKLLEHNTKEGRRLSNMKIRPNNSCSKSALNIKHNLKFYHAQQRSIKRFETEGLHLIDDYMNTDLNTCDRCIVRACCQTKVKRFALTNLDRVDKTLICTQQFVNHFSLKLKDVVDNNRSTEKTLVRAVGDLLTAIIYTGSDLTKLTDKKYGAYVGGCVSNMRSLIDEYIEPQRENTPEYYEKFNAIERQELKTQQKTVKIYLKLRNGSGTAYGWETVEYGSFDLIDMKTRCMTMLKTYIKSVHDHNKTSWSGRNRKVQKTYWFEFIRPTSKETFVLKAVLNDRKVKFGFATADDKLVYNHIV